MERPDSSQISVVIQGPIARTTTNEIPDGLTNLVLNRVRSHLPKSEIILSTWEGENFHHPDCDVYIESIDPGGVRIEGCPLVSSNNLNRQIVSTLAGLRKAVRPYTLKIRTDMILESTRFLDMSAAFPRRSSELRMFKERLVGCSIYSVNPRSFYVHPFHPSDWMFFGLTSDILDLWDIPLAPEPETSHWFQERPKPLLDFMIGDTRRYTPEQYIWQSCVRKHLNLQFDHKSDVSGDNVRLSEMSIANNLVLAEPEQLGFRFHKYQIQLTERLSLYSHNDWKYLYRIYCDPTQQGASGISFHVKSTAGRTLRILKIYLRPVFDVLYRIHARRLAKLRKKG